MLRIKDGIDLKKLEKFGFCLDEEKNQYVYCDDNYHIIVNIDEDKFILTRFQIFYALTHMLEYSSLLYDLITAGLVEKVDIRGEE